MPPPTPPFGGGKDVRLWTLDLIKMTMTLNNNKELLTQRGRKGGGHRIEWLDAMRGFTMILVVAYHVAQFGFVENEKTICVMYLLNSVTIYNYLNYFFFSRISWINAFVFHFT